MYVCYRSSPCVHYCYLPHHISPSSFIISFLSLASFFCIPCHLPLPIRSQSLYTTPGYTRLRLDLPNSLPTKFALRFTEPADCPLRSLRPLSWLASVPTDLSLSLRASFLPLEPHVPVERRSLPSPPLRSQLRKGLSSGSGDTATSSHAILAAIASSSPDAVRACMVRR